MTKTFTEKLIPSVNYLRIRMRAIERLTVMTKHEIIAIMFLFILK